MHKLVIFFFERTIFVHHNYWDEYKRGGFPFLKLDLNNLHKKYISVYDIFKSQIY